MQVITLYIGCVMLSRVALAEQRLMCRTIYFYLSSHLLTRQSRNYYLVDDILQCMNFVQILNVFPIRKIQ